MVSAWSLVTLGLIATAEPTTEPAQLQQGDGRFSLRTMDGELLAAAVFFRQEGQWQVCRACVVESASETEEDRVTQRVRIRPPAGMNGVLLQVRGAVSASEEAFAAETASPHQQRMPLVRTSVGPSLNLRNNAIYDRRQDWLLDGPPGQTRIVPQAQSTGAQRLLPARFTLEATGEVVEIEFRPRFYQRHKGIRFFEPWTYRTWPHSVCGWCSWWAYRTGINQEIVEQAASVFDEQLFDYGYEYIQIDDGYQRDGLGLPYSWLETNDRFPQGLAGIFEAIRQHRTRPGLWTYSHFQDLATVQANPDWFAQSPVGRPHEGPWVHFALIGTQEAALDAITRPLYRRLRQLGWQYVKVDGLRHLLYDGYYVCREHLAALGTTPEEAFRHYLRAIRAELGRGTYMLSCWGVLPEAVGIADGCRLGGDGFGPSSLLQYNSWNNVVWRNDPDHVDIGPEGEEIIRPVVTSMAGAQLLLSDPVETYRDPHKIEGAKRSAPVLVSVPGQLYDFDPSKTDAVREGRRNTSGGAGAGPTDADQRGPRCEWWLQEITRPFGAWTVLARLDWEPMPETTVRFADLGLPDDAVYLVYEFWSRTFLGAFTEAFPAAAQPARDVRVYAIHKRLDRPQVISTSRHISQGGVDLLDVRWEESALTLAGTSAVIRNDPYMLTVYVPEAFRLASAALSHALVPGVEQSPRLARVSWQSPATEPVEWTLRFVRLE